MGLFDKKYCDICGEKIGLLGNRKVEDGNICSKCNKKLSPLFNERKRSTVDEIRQQLEYRAQNEVLLRDFNPSRVYGCGEKLYVDLAKRQFCVESGNNWREKNPDLIDFSQVMSCSVDIKENRDEIFIEDDNGNRRSYKPPRFEVEYEFLVNICVNSPYFSEISFELTGYNQRPDSRLTDLYRQYEMQAQEIQNIFSNQQVGYAQPQYAQPQQVGYAQPQYAQPQQVGYAQPQYAQPQQVGYAQPINQGVAYAAGVAQPQYAQPQQVGYAQPQQGGFAQPQQRMVVCDKCGWQSASTANVPKFCPCCGDPIDFNDMR